MNAQGNKRKKPRTSQTRIGNNFKKTLPVKLFKTQTYQSWFQKNSEVI